MVSVPPNPLRRIMFVALAVAAGLAALSWHPSDSLADDPYSEDLVEGNIGDCGYAVPRNYLSHVTRSTVDGRDMIAVLHVLWPDLEPRTPENVHLWRRRHPTRQIRILINDSRVEGYEQLQNALFNASQSSIPFQKVGEPASFQLLEYLRVVPNGSSTRYFIPAGSGYPTPLGNPIMINCSDHTTDEDKEVFEVEVLCAVDYRLEDGAMLYFTFFLINLEHWREIDASVRSLITSFER